MSPNNAAKALLQRIALPGGAVTILPWHEAGKVVMRVLVDKSYARSIQAPTEFEGYPVVVAERVPGTAYH